MANPLANPAVTTSFGLANTAANLIGLNNWQLYPGSYNGVKFHLVTSSGASTLDMFNPASGAIANIEGLITKASQTGVNLTPPDNTQLPYGTVPVAKNVIDAGTKKYARHRIPNANANVLEDLGWDGETIRVIGIIFGSSSLTASNNLFNVMINPTAVSAKNRNVLVHPVLGTITNVLLTSYRRIHTSEAYKAIAYEFVFETSSPVQAQAIPTSALSQIATVFNTVSSIYTAINQSINLASIIFTSGKTYIDAIFQSNHNAATITAAQFVGVAQLLNTNLSPPGFSNPTLSAIDASKVNLSIGSPNVSPSVATSSTIASSNSSTVSSNAGIVSVNLSQYNSVFNTGLPNGVTQVVSLYAQNVQTVINQINGVMPLTSQVPTPSSLVSSASQAAAFQATIANLEASVVALNNVAQTLLANFFGNTTTLIVQNNTTLEEILFQSNINFNTVSNIQQVLTLNAGKFNSINFIPAGTQIVLPNGLS